MAGKKSQIYIIFYKYIYGGIIHDLSPLDMHKQTNKQVCSDDTGGMSVPIEKIGAEVTASTKLPSSLSKKSSKPRKKNPAVRQSVLSGDYGYGSGSSQVYMSGNSQGGGYVQYSQGTGSSGYAEEPSSIPEEEVLTQQLRLGNPGDSNKVLMDGGKCQDTTMVSSGPQGVVSVQHHMMQQQSYARHHHHQIQSPPGSQYPNLSPSHQHHTLISAHHSGSRRDVLNRAKNHTASSGYCSIRSSPPPRSIKSPDDTDGSSIVSSSLRGSTLTNSFSTFSTFSSSSSRIPSPCSNSDPIRAYHSLSPGATGLFPSGNSPGLQCAATAGAERHGFSLRVNNSFAPQHHHQPPHQHHERRHSDELRSIAGTRPWQFGDSKYSNSSELSDELLESLPPGNRRHSFSKNQPLPLPKSMQHNFGMGIKYEREASQPQNGFMGSSDSTLPLRHFDTLSGSVSSTQERVFSQDYSQERAYSQEKMFSQDGQFSGDATYMSMMPHHGNSDGSNMVVGDMDSFASAFSEETEYFESLLQANSPVK